jgi:hypothetical protein
MTDYDQGYDGFFNTNSIDPMSENAYGYQPVQSVPVTGNWIEAYTAEGYLYYYNDQTGESSWTLPGTANAPYDTNTQQSYDNSLAVQPYSANGEYSYDPNSYNTYGQYQSNDQYQETYNYDQTASSNNAAVPLAVPNEVIYLQFYIFYIIINTLNRLSSLQNKKHFSVRLHYLVFKINGKMHLYKHNFS